MGTYFLNIVVCLCFCLFERGLVFAQNSQEYDALVEWRQEKKKDSTTRISSTHMKYNLHLFFFSRTKKSEKRRRQSVLMKVMLPKHTCTVSLKVEIEKNSKRNKKRKRSGFYHCTSHTGTGEKKNKKNEHCSLFICFAPLRKFGSTVVAWSTRRQLNRKLHTCSAVFFFIQHEATNSFFFFFEFCHHSEEKNKKNENDFSSVFFFCLKINTQTDKQTWT